MKAVHRLGRRSFLVSVVGASALGLTGCAAPRATEDAQWDPLDNSGPRERGSVRTGREARRSNCADGDTGPQSDPRDNGRRCQPR
jgi:hypothetical protein